MIKDREQLPIVNTPSQSPEDSASGLLGTLKLALNKTLQNLDCCLPAKIISYDRVKNRATVEPLYKVTTTGGETLSMAKIAGIPTLLLGGGDVFISFDLKEGDLGWIIANDQDISLFLQSYESAPGNTKRMHSFSDAVFIPDLMKGYQLATEPMAGEAVIQSRLGSTVIGISTDKISIRCPSTEAELVVVANVELLGKESTEIPKNVLAKSNGHLFKLKEKVTLDQQGRAQGMFVAVDYGSYICPANSLTEIVTAIEGWESLNNPEDGKKQTIQQEGSVETTAKTIVIQGNNITLEGEVMVKGPLNIQGAVNINGEVRVEGNITASGQIQGNT